MTHSERAHLFGAGERLFGVVTAPAEPRPERPAVLLLNAGLIHRVGPFRLHVELARLLAERGFVVLRMDQSSIGDSGTRPGGTSYEERSVQDAGEALDFLGARYQAQTAIALGLCAGAMNAHRITVADARVVGAVLLDGYAYRTPGYWRAQLLPRLVDPRAWRANLARLAALARDRVGAGPEPAGADLPGEDATSAFDQEWPPRDRVRAELERALARGARFLFVYTGGWSDYVHEGQFAEMFPDLAPAGRVRVRFFPRADHTYILAEHRRALIDEVEAFVRTFA